MKSNYQRAKVTVILIWLFLAIEMVLAFLSYVQMVLLQQGINNNEEYPLSALKTNGYILGTIGILSVAIYVATAVAFLLWFSRAYSNLYIKVKDLTFSKNAAVWVWFIPIVNLFRPYTIMKEMYKRTDNYIKENGLTANNLDLSTQKISIWWTLGIVNAIVVSIVFRLDIIGYEEDIDGLTTVTWLDIALTLMNIPLSVYTVKIIKKYAEAEKVLLKRNSEK